MPFISFDDEADGPRYLSKTVKGVLKRKDGQSIFVVPESTLAELDFNGARYRAFEESELEELVTPLGITFYREAKKRGYIETIVNRRLPKRGYVEINFFVEKSKLPEARRVVLDFDGEDLNEKSGITPISRITPTERAKIESGMLSLV